VIVVDTSVWIDHFRKQDTPLRHLLNEVQIALHPCVWGELLLSGLPKSGPVAEALIELDEAPLASAAEVAAFIVWANLAGTGLGYVDAHLLVSAKMLPNGSVLTNDRKLHAQAVRLGIAYTP
jgi:predicted nucleic acid-binding protein